jgi:hypothetical protein
MGTRGPFPGGKVQPGHDADHSPPSSARLKNEQEVQLLSPLSTCMAVVGHLYFYFGIL